MAEEGGIDRSLVAVMHRAPPAARWGGGGSPPLVRSVNVTPTCEFRADPFFPRYPLRMFCYQNRQGESRRPSGERPHCKKHKSELEGTMGNHATHSSIAAWPGSLDTPENFANVVSVVGLPIASFLDQPDLDAMAGLSQSSLAAVRLARIQSSFSEDVLDEGALPPDNVSTAYYLRQQRKLVVRLRPDDAPPQAASAPTPLVPNSFPILEVLVLRVPASDTARHATASGRHAWWLVMAPNLKELRVEVEAEVTWDRAAAERAALRLSAALAGRSQWHYDPLQRLVLRGQWPVLQSRRLIQTLYTIVHDQLCPDGNHCGLHVELPLDVAMHLHHSAAGGPPPYDGLTLVSDHPMGPPGAPPHLPAQQEPPNTNGNDALVRTYGAIVPITTRNQDLELTAEAWANVLRRRTPDSPPMVLEVRNENVFWEWRPPAPLPPDTHPVALRLHLYEPAHVLGKEAPWPPCKTIDALFKFERLYPLHEWVTGLADVLRAWRPQVSVYITVKPYHKVSIPGQQKHVERWKEGSHRHRLTTMLFQLATAAWVQRCDGEQAPKGTHSVVFLPLTVEFRTSVTIELVNPKWDKKVRAQGENTDNDLPRQNRRRSPADGLCKACRRNLRDLFRDKFGFGSPYLQGVNWTNVAAPKRKRSSEEENIGDDAQNPKRRGQSRLADDLRVENMVED